MKLRLSEDDWQVWVPLLISQGPPCRREPDVELTEEEYAFVVKAYADFQKAGEILADKPKIYR